MKLPLECTEIIKIIPHRYPILLVDRVIEFAEGQHIVGIKCVSSNEPFFNGHFPQRPIMPGVLMLEALAQLGVIYAKLSMRERGVEEETLSVFAGLDEVRFRRQVIPGDVLRLEMVPLKRRGGIWKMQGTAAVEGEIAVEGILTASEVPLPD